MSKLVISVILFTIAATVYGQQPTSPKPGHHFRKMSHKLMCNSTISPDDLKRMDKAHDNKKTCISKLFVSITQGYIKCS